MFTGFRGLTLLEITWYKYRNYIYFSASKLFNQRKVTSTPRCLRHSHPHPHPQIFASNTVNYSSNKKNSKLCSLGSIFNRVNIQRVGAIKNERKMYLQSCWKLTPGIFSTTLGLNFQRRKSIQGSIFNVEKWTPVNFQPGSKYFVTPVKGCKI
jgi:hypothetical protein